MPKFKEKDKTNMEEKIRKLLKLYGAKDDEIENFMNDLANYVEDKIEEVFDEDREEDYEVE